ncbi:RmlC-like cupin [Auricularia subglabra TFB-10046 SS5]|nr:RmlC-like cupin [Auricularia subglabra TFB-10046 SS5]
MRAVTLSTILSTLPLAIHATSTADKAAALHNAFTQVERISILADDSDFVFSFTDPKNKATKGAGGSLIAANAANFPALIGNGMALTIGAMEPCSMNSPHTHPRATEMLLMTSGQITAGFLAENGARFVVNNVTTLAATVFPAGSIHFQANYDCSPATFIAALNNEDPGTTQIAQRFFGLPPDVVGASLGGLGVQEVANLAGLIPDNLIAAQKECFDRCTLTYPAQQGTSQQQGRVPGNAFPPGITPKPPTQTTSPPPAKTPVNHDVQVGADNQLVYSPQYLTANVGDTVTFHFVSKNHTSTRSSFAEPCSSLPEADGGFDSKFMPVAEAKPFTITVADEKPIWVYCRQTGHCSKGMVFAVNPPTTGPNTFDAFLKNAEASGADTPTSTTSTSAPYPTGNAKIIDVTVGRDGGLTYQPDDISAQVGDLVRFTFVLKNHTVTQSSFNDPCTPLPPSEGFDSDFRPVSGGVTSQFNVTVKDDKPIWFFCKQHAPGAALSHCQQGMNGAINAPKTGRNTLSAFKTRASSSD